MPNQTLSLKLPPTGTVWGLGNVKLTANLIRLPKLASVVWASLLLSHINLSPSYMVSSLETGDEYLPSLGAILCAAHSAGPRHNAEREQCTSSTVGRDALY